MARQHQLVPWCLLLGLLCSLSIAANLPVVDLGYRKQKASVYNASGDYFRFIGIRYARPPTGKLRWRAPQAPIPDPDTVHDGSDSRNCPHSTPGWNKINDQFVDEYLAGKPITVTKEQLKKANSTKGIREHFDDGDASEDCLFLDVSVPNKILTGTGSGAPVLVWFYGGGFVKGSKSGSDPAGLLLRSLQGGREGVIHVSFNYRLGAFGWLAGPSVEDNGIANAGLWDQRFALEWVQKHISKFGGDPKRVTIFGESAGGSSILHQITAFGGERGPPPFQQAILQSPGFHQQNSKKIRENQYNRLLQLTGAKSMEGLRQLPTQKLAKASAIQVHQAEFGLFTYGPAVDTVFVPDLPGVLLEQGKFYKNLKVMVAHNSNEGLNFVDPFTKTQDQYKDFLRLMFPVGSDEFVNKISEDLYPPDYSGKENYKDPYARQALTIAENAFVCNTYYVDKAFNGNTYAYRFSVYPGRHGMDVGYTYYNGASSKVANVTVAIAMQDYITTFAQNGKPTSPNVPALPAFETYGSNQRIIDLSGSRIIQSTDDANKRRCNYWQKAPYAAH